VSNTVEYVFGASVTLADAFARQQGWRPCSRAAWLKRDGTTVRFLCLMEQLEIVAAGVMVHVIGRAGTAANPEAARCNHRLPRLTPQALSPDAHPCAILLPAIAGGGSL
jgi:hypothetical protein